MSRNPSGSQREFVAGVRVAPFRVMEPEPHHPGLLVVLDAREDRLLLFDVLGQTPSTPEVADKIVAALPPGRSRLRLRIDDPGTARALGARLGPGAFVEVGPTPEIDGAIDAFAMHREAEVGHEFDWRFEDATTSDDWIAFYSAAGQFAKAKPWQRVDDSQCFVFDVPDLGWRGGCATIMGHAGEAFGLQVAASIEDHVAWTRFACAGPPRGRLGPGRPLLALHFDQTLALPGGRAQATHARKHGYPVKPKGLVPYAMRLDVAGEPVATTANDCRLLTVLLAAVQSFVSNHDELFDGPPEQQVRMSATIRTPAGSFPVAVTAPPDPGLLPWRWGEESAGEGIRNQEIESIAAGFEAARREAGATEAEALADSDAAQELLRVMGALDGSPVAWSADDVSSFLLEFYPERGSFTGAAVASYPDRLERFLAWLEAGGRLPPRSLDEARRRLADCRASFIERACDSRRYGPGKKLLAGAREAGVDLGDEAAVRAYLDREAERLLSEAPRSKAWVWDGQGPPPDPAKPCPCGSGRRYKKCCLPR